MAIETVSTKDLRELNNKEISAYVAENGNDAVALEKLIKAFAGYGPNFDAIRDAIKSHEILAKTAIALAAPHYSYHLMIMLDDAIESYPSLIPFAFSELAKSTDEHCDNKLYQLAYKHENHTAFALRELAANATQNWRACESIYRLAKERRQTIPLAIELLEKNKGSLYFIGYLGQERRSDYETEKLKKCLTRLETEPHYSYHALAVETLVRIGSAEAIKTIGRYLGEEYMVGGYDTINDYLFSQKDQYSDHLPLIFKSLAQLGAQNAECAILAAKEIQKICERRYNGDATICKLAVDSVNAHGGAMAKETLFALTEGSYYYPQENNLSRFVEEKIRECAATGDPVYTAALIEFLRPQRNLLESTTKLLDMREQFRLAGDNDRANQIGDALLDMYRAVEPVATNIEKDIGAWTVVRERFNASGLNFAGATIDLAMEKIALLEQIRAHETTSATQTPPAPDIA